MNKTCNALAALAALATASALAADVYYLRASDGGGQSSMSGAGSCPG